MYNYNTTFFAFTAVVRLAYLCSNPFSICKYSIGISTLIDLANKNIGTYVVLGVIFFITSPLQ